jgi:hypothetical protein
MIALFSSIYPSKTAAESTKEKYHYLLQIFPASKQQQFNWN